MGAPRVSRLLLHTPTRSFLFRREASAARRPPRLPRLPPRCLFVNTLPVDTLLRVWDMLIVHGPMVPRRRRTPPAPAPAPAHTYPAGSPRDAVLCPWTRCSSGSAPRCSRSTSGSCSPPRTSSGSPCSTPIGRSNPPLDEAPAWTRCSRAPVDGCDRLQNLGHCMFDAEHLLHVSFKSLVQTQSARRALSTAERVHETVMAVTVQGCAAPSPPVASRGRDRVDLPPLGPSIAQPAVTCPSLSHPTAGVPNRPTPTPPPRSVRTPSSSRTRGGSRRASAASPEARGAGATSP